MSTSRFYGQLHDSDVSQCAFCVHDHANGSCDAFSKGKPLVILTNEHDHKKPYEGDKGILFEPIPHKGVPCDRSGA